MKITIFAICIAHLMANTTLFAEPVGTFYYEGSVERKSWVTQGKTGTITSTSWNFKAIRHEGAVWESAQFVMQPKEKSDHSGWRLAFFPTNADERFKPDIYTNAARFPAQRNIGPMMDFDGDGHGINGLDGWFNILEVVYATDGSIQQFAVDFMIYEEGVRDRWSYGSFRFNSAIPINKRHQALREL